MGNIQCNSDTCNMHNSAELEHIEHLITGGENTANILKMYPQYNKEAIESIVRRVAGFCWYSADEWKEITDYE